MQKNCCYECLDRTSECHAYCKKYLAYRAEKDRDIKKRAKGLDYSRIDIIQRSKQRAMTRKSFVPVNV